MKATNKILTLVIAIALLAGCSEEIKPEPFTYSQNFSGKNQKTWKYKSIALWEQDKQEVSYTLTACIADDLYIFFGNEEKRYEVTNGATKCATDEPDLLLSDTWAFTNAGATLYIVIPFLSDLTLPYIVREISKSNMLLEIFINEAGTQSYRIAFEVVSEN
ncbi:MAG: hypothetical protein KF775_02660 [Cyclobacteriaceae bacterium]|nr:hypothetical protein [Cyclobacteriaceae bacterium]